MGQNIILQSLRLLMMPVARFCVRHSLRIQDMLEAAKVAIIRAAEEELRANAEPVNVSRLAAMTGIHRRDVIRIFQRGETLEDPQGTLVKIIGMWQQTPAYCGKSGRPRVLSYEGADAEFKRLVYRVSADLNPSTVLFELRRSGIVEYTRDGLKLIARAYVPSGDSLAGLNMLSEDTVDLMQCVVENVEHRHETPNLHVKTIYDSVLPEAEPKIREWMMREGSALHQKARNFISQFDYEINRRLKRCREPLRVALGSFSLIAPAKSRTTKEEE